MSGYCDAQALLAPQRYKKGYFLHKEIGSRFFGVIIKGTCLNVANSGRCSSKNLRIRDNGGHCDLLGDDYDYKGCNRFPLHR